MSLRRTINLFATCTVLAGLSAATAQAETPEEMITRLDKVSQKVKSMYMVQEQSTESPFMKMSSTIKSWHMREGEAYKFRAETEGHMTYMGSAEPQNMASLTVCDGKILWTEVKQMGMVQVTKQKAPPGASNLKTILDTAKKGTATVKPAEEIHGHKCAVLEILTGEGEQATTMTYWLSEEHGAVIQMIMKGKMVGEMKTVTKELKTGASVDAAKLTYTPPEGAQIQDMTGGG